MKLTICTASIFLSLLLGASGATPTDESIDRMMAAMHVEKSLDQIFLQLDAGVKNGLEEGLQRSLQGRDLSASQKEAVDTFARKLSVTLKDELSFAKMKAVYLQAYRETLTQEEVNSLTAFYSSPAGQSVVDKIPLAMQKAGVLMQPRIRPVLEKIQGMEHDFAKELAKTK